MAQDSGTKKIKTAAKRIITGMIIGTVTALLFAAFTQFLFVELFISMENKSYDMRYIWKYKMQDKSEMKNKTINDIVVVDIDDRSMAKLGRYNKWPRSYHAQVIDYLKEGGAAAVVFDILFFDADDKTKEADEMVACFHKGKQKFFSGIQDKILQRFEQGLHKTVVHEMNYDQEFVQATQRAGIVYHSCVFNKTYEYANKSDYENKVGSVWEKSLGMKGYFNASEVTKKSFETWPVLDGIFPDLARAAKITTFINVTPDQDGVHRRITLFQNFGEHTYPAMSLQVAMEMLGVDKQELKIVPGQYVKLGHITSIPIDRQGRMLINYMGLNKVQVDEELYRTFRYIPYYDILKRRIPADYFKDKIFIIGSSAAALFDIVASPFEKIYPGVELHANIIHNILTNNYMKEISTQWKVLILLLLGVTVGINAYNLKPLLSVSITFVLILGYFVVAMSVFNDRNLWLEIIRPVVVIIMTYMAVMVYRYITEEKDKKFLHNTFKQYLSPELIEMMYENKTEPKLGGDSGVRTAFFTDIESFSSFSELMTAGQLVELLNEYLSAMTDILLRYNGTLDKYIGDAIVAFFGAPFPMQDHPRQACLVALEMQSRLADLRKKWSVEKAAENRNIKNLEPDLWGPGNKWPKFVHNMKMRIGINTGEIVTGNMGSDRRMNYTMMGDTVNLGARLESGAKQYGIYTMISEFTYELAKNDMEVREVDFIIVKGKTKPVKVYELIAKKNEMTEDQKKIVDIFYQGLNAYKRQEWDKATDLFNQSLSMEPNKKMNPSKVYLERCAEYRADPPGADWDGVYVMKSK